MKKTNNGTLSEQLQNIISTSHKEANSIPLTHKYMAWYMQFNNKNCVFFKLFYQTSPLSNKYKPL